MRINHRNLDALLELLPRAGRIPGGAIGIVSNEKLIYARGFGRRALTSREPVQLDTVYPIASTTKAINATLLGILIDQGRLDWDAPVQRYIPHFRLGDAAVSARVTLRDLVTMRTGLPRHDWVWWGYPISRAQLTEQLAHLELSADFRQRFQYSNLSVTVAGHIAEIVTGERWEALAERYLFKPLGMKQTRCHRPRRGNFTRSYHENSRRKLILSRWPATEVTAPSGGAVHSTIRDMARWISFNLRGGTLRGRRLISRPTMTQIHSPQIIIGERAAAQMPAGAAYALGWFVDSYGSHKRLSHGGYLHDVASSVMLFPELRTGIVSFVNFGCSRLAHLLSQCAFDAVAGSSTAHALEQQLLAYEHDIDATRKRNAAVPRVRNAPPSRPLTAYCGVYEHAGYGSIGIRMRDRTLYLRRGEWQLPLRHWHYEVWVSEESNVWAIHEPHPFDRHSPVHFCAETDGRIGGVSIRLETQLPPILFTRRR